MSNTETKLTIINPAGGLQVVASVQSNNAIVLALQTLRIYEATDKEIVTYLSPAIEKARLDLGLKTDNIVKADNKLFIDSVLKDLKTQFSAMTVGEIPIAVYNFTRGKYHAPGKDVFLTIAALSNGFRGYMQDQTRLQAKQELLMLTAPTEDELTPTPEQVEERRIATIVNAFEVFKQTGLYEDHFNYVYDAVEKYQEIPFDIERKKKIAEEARQFLIKQNKGQAADKHDKKKKAMNVKLLELVIVKDVPMTEALQAMKTALRSQAKKMALIEFFKDLDKKNEHIKHYLKLI